MKKTLFGLLGLIALLYALYGCCFNNKKSYFYELNNSNQNNKINVYYFIDVEKSDNYSIYVNYLVDDLNKRGEIMRFIDEEGRTGNYKSSISVFDENNKLIDSVAEYPIQLHHYSVSETDRVLAVDVFPKYFALEKGKRYYFKMNIDNINLSAIGSVQKQIEITILYKAK